MNMPVGGSAERLIEAPGRNERCPPAARHMRHSTAANLAERRGKASSLGQVETHNRRFSPKPAKRRGFNTHFARMRGPARFAAPGAMAVEKMIERSLDL